MSPSAGKPASIQGLHHLKLPCFSLRKTVDFYTRILPFTHLPQFDHLTPDNKLFGQVIVHQPTALLLQVRYNPEQASKCQGLDPITFAVDTRKELEEWEGWLDEHGVRRSRVLAGLKGWFLCCEDPDKRIVRLYAQAEQAESVDWQDRDEFWLGTVIADPDCSVEVR